MQEQVQRSDHLEQGTEADTGFLGQTAGLQVEGGEAAGPGQGSTQGAGPAIPYAVALQGQAGQHPWLSQYADAQVTLPRDPIGLGSVGSLP